MRLELDVFGDPKGQPRPRAFARRMGNRFVARVYDSDVADAWKQEVDKALNATDWTCEKGAVILAFWFQRPKSHFRANGELKSWAPALHVSKPDLDNLAKLVLDRMTKHGIWPDDSCVVSLTVTKNWAAERKAGCKIIVDGW